MRGVSGARARGWGNPVIDINGDIQRALGRIETLLAQHAVELARLHADVRELRDELHSTRGARGVWLALAGLGSAIIGGTVYIIGSIMGGHK